MDRLQIGVVLLPWKVLKGQHWVHRPHRYMGMYSSAEHLLQLEKISMHLDRRKGSIYDASRDITTM